MALKRRNSPADVIRCDEPDYLIWKWHPAGSQPGENRRENAIRWQSSLRVKEGSVAVFVYRQKDGTLQDFIEGPYDEMLSTKNLPVLAGIIGLAYGGNSPFQAEVYFINLARVIQCRFAVPFFDVYDPRFQDFGVPVAVRGTLTFRIRDYREFIKLHRLEQFSMADFSAQVRDAVAKYTKQTVANLPQSRQMSVLQLEQMILPVSEQVEESCSARLAQDFGVTVSGVDISAIEIDKSGDGYARLRAVTQDVTSAMIGARTEAEVRNIGDMQRVNMENYRETMRIQREEAQFAQHLQTESANMSAFRLEKQAEVGVAGAEALGKMGSSMPDGGGSGGFNPAGIMTGLAMGGVVAQNIAQTMKGAMGSGAAPDVPPPVPQTLYHVAQNGASVGAFDTETLSRMLQSGQIGADTLVWTAGMPAWASLRDVPALQELLRFVPPDIPSPAKE